MTRYFFYLSCHTSFHLCTLDHLYLFLSSSTYSFFIHILIFILIHIIILCKGERSGLSDRGPFDHEPFDLDNMFSSLSHNESKGCVELVPKDVEDEGEGYDYP